MPNFSNILNKSFVIVIAVIALYVGLTIYTDLERFFDVIKKIDYSIIISVLALMSVVVLLLAFRFHRLIRSLDIDLPLKKSILFYIVGLAFSITPASSGTLIKSYLIKQEKDIEITKTAPIIFVEKWNELNSILIILIIFLFFNLIYETVIITVIGIIISISFIIIVKNYKVFLVFKNLTRKIKFLNRLDGLIENSQTTFNITLNSRNLLEGFLLTTSAKIIEAVAVFLVFQAIHMDLDFIFATQLYYTSILSGFLSLIPGGVIVTEASLLGLLTKFGYDFTLASAVVILIRLATIWFVTVMGLFASKFIIHRKSS